MSDRPHSASRPLPPELPSIGFLLLLGFGSGFLNGLLGSGGGILLVLVLGRLRTQVRGSASSLLPTTDLSPRDLYANALSVMVPLSLLSAGRYWRAGVLSMENFSRFLLPAILGGLAGGWLLDRLRLRWIRLLFALLILISGLVMLIR